MFKFVSSFAILFLILSVILSLTPSGQSSSDVQKCRVHPSDREECPSFVINDQGQKLDGWIMEEWTRAFEKVSKQMNQFAKLKPKKEEVPEFLKEFYEKNNLFAS